MFQNNRVQLISCWSIFFKYKETYRIIIINKWKVKQGSTKRTVRAQLNRPQVIYITAFIISKPITFHRMAPQSDFNEVFAHSHVWAPDAWTSQRSDSFHVVNPGAITGATNPRAGNGCYWIPIQIAQSGSFGSLWPQFWTVLKKRWIESLSAIQNYADNFLSTFFSRIVQFFSAKILESPSKKCKTVQFTVQCASTVFCWYSDPVELIRFELAGVICSVGDFGLTPTACLCWVSKWIACNCVQRALLRPRRSSRVRPAAS